MLKVLIEKGETISREMATAYLKELFNPTEQNKNETEESIKSESLTIRSFLTNLLGIPINDQNEVSFHNHNQNDSDE